MTHDNTPSSGKNVFLGAYGPSWESLNAWVFTEAKAVHVNSARLRPFQGGTRERGGVQTTTSVLPNFSRGFAESSRGSDIPF